MPLTVDACAAQHQGDRKEQQDRVAILSHPRQRGVVLAVVADGMGGHAGGALAAEQVVHTAKTCLEHFSPSEESPLRLLEGAMLETHAMIKASRFMNEKDPHSTAVMLLLQAKQVTWAHCGDSRMYRFSDGKPVFRSVDHSYVEHLIADHEAWVNEPNNWNGRDLFIRPDIETDITYERRPAVAHMGKWLGDSPGNLLVVLGDLGTGKTTLARFLAYQLACSFRDDPLRHPAPVLIPLREVRKEVALDSIVVKHFRDRGLPGVSFPRFEHLVRLGKIVLFFDAFDEMADRVRWDITQANFQELRRAAASRDGSGRPVGPPPAGA